MYECLQEEASTLEIDVEERSLNKRIKGLYGDNVIWINKNIDTSIEKACVLAEELGHYHTSAGDILDQRKLENRKQERRARIWAAEKILPLYKFIDAFDSDCTSRFEVAEHLRVTEQFLEQSLNYYREKYGNEVQVDQEHILFLSPLAIYKII